jgi:hypothetical protein
MTSRTPFTLLLVLFAASTVASASCGGSDTTVKPPPSVATVTGVTSGEFVTATTGAGGAGGAGGMSSTSSAGGGGGAGGMTGCMDASECPGMKSACQTPICSAGVCDTLYLPYNTQPPTQSAGDCKAIVCDGAGSTKTIDDEQDAFDDKNPCTDDICVAGSTTHPASYLGKPCSDGKACDGKGACL